MKTKTILLAAALAGGVMFAGAAVVQAKPNVEILFDHPENFTDIKDSYMPTDKGEQANLDEIRDYLVDKASRYLRDGQTLTITFTNIDLAGDFEPQRGPDAADIRVIKDIYPPRLDFTYKVVDAHNKVLKEGKEQLRDMNFLTRTNPINDRDTMPWEKDMLSDWLRSMLRGIGKT